MAQLEYDNSAFYYFMIAMLSIYLFPGWILTIRYVIGAFAPEKTTHRSKLEKDKMQKMGSNLRGVEKLSSRFFVINACVLGATSLLFSYLVYLVKNDAAIASFDPYTILDLDRGATDKQIKKMYKIKALQFHPDKNIGDERAAQNFMMVAKAYEALTDAVAKENWEKYGNPDGKQSFEMSIGLPTFLMNGDNHNGILLVYLLIMVVVVPVVVYMIYTNSQLYGENNIMYRTLNMYQVRLLRGTSGPKLGDLPEIFVSAAEFEGSLKPDGDEAVIKAMHAAFTQLKDAGAGAGSADAGVNKKKASKALKAAKADDSKLFLPAPSKFLMDVKNGRKPTPERDGVAPNPNYFWTNIKGSLILHHHLGRAQIAASRVEVPPLPAAWESALQLMLTSAPNLLGALVSIVSEYPHQSMMKTGLTKFETTYEVMKFSQCLTQGITPRGAIKKEHAPFYQLPHVTPREVAVITKEYPTLQDYIRVKFNAFCAESKESEPNLSEADLRQMWSKMGAEEKDRKELLPAYVRKGLSEMDDAKRQDVNAVCDILPDLDVDVQWFVDDEDFIAQGDTVTLKVTITRHHMPDSASKAAQVHAPFSPLKQDEGWWIVLRASGSNWQRYAPWEMRMEKISDQGRVVVHEMKFPAPVEPPNKYKYSVHLVSDSYLGLDFKEDFDLQVEAAAEVEKVKEESDDELLEETPLEMFMGGNNNVDSDVSDSDEDEDDDDEEAAARAAAAAKAKARAGGGKQQQAGEEKGADGLTAAQRKKKEARLAKQAKSKEDGDAVIVDKEDAEGEGEDLD